MSSVVRLSRRQRELLHSPKQAPAWLKAMARKSREQKQRWFVDGTPFPVGQKKVFLYARLPQHHHISARRKEKLTHRRAQS